MKRLLSAIVAAMLRVAKRWARPGGGPKVAAV